jgi:hypothetical protein
MVAKRTARHHLQTPDPASSKRVGILLITLSTIFLQRFCQLCLTGTAIDPGTQIDYHAIAAENKQ